jgi:hypothetical protein
MAKKFIPIERQFIEFLRSKNSLYFFRKMDLNLFGQDIKKICLLVAYLQSLSGGQKNTDFRRY